MGPTIILDKSALQSLSKEEIYFLFKHYYVIVPPVLLVEILGDLEKKNPKNRLSEDEVRILAQKLLSLDSCINSYYVDLCNASLMGYDIPLRGQAMVDGGVPLRADNGRPFVFLDEPEESKALRNWQKGIFSDSERLLARHWRESTRTLVLEEYKNKFRKIFGKLPCLDSFNDLAAYVDRKLSNPDKGKQLDMIKNFIAEIGGKQQIRDLVCKRWIDQGMPLFSRFSPYAYYCARANMLFIYGLIFDLITTRSTNRVDLEYLYYLPFCMVFSSGDPFFYGVVPLLIRSNQDFVERDILKKDLKWISDEWDNLTDDERKERSQNYGSYPPDNEASITYRLWQKNMKPRSSKTGKEAAIINKEDNDSLIENVRPFLDAIDKYRKRTAG